MKFAHALKELFFAIPDKWIAVFVFFALLIYYHFHPVQFVESMINTVLGALVMGLTIGFKRLENAPYKAKEDKLTVETTVTQEKEPTE